MSATTADILRALAAAHRRDATGCDRTAEHFEDTHSGCRRYAGRARSLRIVAVLLDLAARMTP